MVIPVGLAAIALALGAAPQDKEIEALADSALGAPPELAADALIRIVESGKLANRKRSLELLETALDLAGSAKHPYKLTGAVGAASHTDSDAGVLTSALEPGLDALSLRCRAVTAVFRPDRARALELFERIPAPRFDPLSCRDALRPGVQPYYALVQQVFETAYSPEARRKGRDVEMLERQALSVWSPFQLEPVARLLVAVKLGDEDFARLAGVYAAAMKQISADDRTFSSVGHGLTQAIYDLAAACRKRGVSTYGLVDAYRSYLVRHLRGARCEDTAGKDGPVGAQANMVQLFNTSLRHSAPELADIQPIAEDETKPAAVEGKAEIYHFWEKPSTRPLLMRLKELRFGTKEQQAELAKQPRRKDGMAPFLSVEQRHDPLWEGRVRDYLKDLGSWQKDADEPAASFFHELCFVYAPLIELIPPGSLRDAVLASYIEFLRGHPMQKDDPPQWLVEFRRLFGLTDFTPEETAAIREHVLRAGDRTMALYAALEAWKSAAAR